MLIFRRKYVLFAILNQGDMTHTAKPPTWWKSPLAATIVIVLLACAVGWYMTREAAPTRPASKPAVAVPVPVDERLFKTARQVSALADTAEEQDLARQAMLLADHELDQAFASALREAATPKAAANPELQKLEADVAAVKARIATRQQTIARLTKAAGTNSSADNLLELAKAQLALDQDELEDAQQDLARAGGDEHGRLERAMQQHDAVQHAALPTLAPPVPAGPETLAGQIQAWSSLAGRKRQVEAALDEASTKAALSTREHRALEQLVGRKPVTDIAAGLPADDEASDEEEEDPAAMLDRLRRLSDQRKTLAELDRRIQDSEEIADLYRRWDADLDARSRSILHLILLSTGLLSAVCLGAVLLSRIIRQFLGQQADRRRRHQLRLILTISVQLAGLLAALLIIFGPPSQAPTIIGLTTAGLTVVMKDFIVSFFGWFTLMGKNGIRIGDWVEIEGVSGEVVETGVFQTVLLEIGSSTGTGHPSGRRVSFLNKFALERHWFNFSTEGQWLWDELEVSLPVTAEGYQLAARIRDAVEDETRSDAEAAEKDWERITRQYGSRQFSARPSMDLKPSAVGLSAAVRYITRGPQRWEVKSRLYQRIVGLIHGSETADTQLSSS